MTMRGAQVQRLDPIGTTGDPGEVNTLDLAALVRAAIDETRTPLKIIALCWGVDPSYLTRMLAGEKPIPLAKLPLLPDEVERALLRQYCAAHGLVIQDDGLEARALGDLLIACGRVVSVLRGLPRPRPVRAMLRSATPAARVTAQR